jgi:hypothetical protein
MATVLKVAFAGQQIRIPRNHLCRMRGATNTLAANTLAATAIRDADPAATPPEIRTVSGETLFVPAEQRGQLERFCRANQIPIRTRADVWSDLLEPFLDSEFTPEDDAATLRRLLRAGLTAAEVAGIRARVGPLMRAYNAIHWDGFHLGLADLLDAVATISLPERDRAELGETASFYAWAMRIANGTAAEP